MEIGLVGKGIEREAEGQLFAVHIFSTGTGAVSSTVRATGPEALLALVLLVMEASSLPVASAMTACRPSSLAAFPGEPTNRTDQPLG